MIKEPPVTPQELREHALAIEGLCGANLHELRPKASPCKDCATRANRLRELADWLEQHMPLYREAMGLLDHAKFVVEDIPKRKRFRALLAKLKGE